MRKLKNNKQHKRGFVRKFFMIYYSQMSQYFYIHFNVSFWYVSYITVKSYINYNRSVVYAWKWNKHPSSQTLTFIILERYNLIRCYTALRAGGGRGVTWDLSARRVACWVADRPRSATDALRPFTFYFIFHFIHYFCFFSIYSLVLWQCCSILLYCNTGKCSIRDFRFKQLEAYKI